MRVSIIITKSKSTRRERAMWTIQEIATGESVKQGDDPVLFDSFEDALGWADEHIAREQASEYAIVDVATL
jgi:hypothetical protein